MLGMYGKRRSRTYIDSKGDGEVYRYWAEMGAMLVMETGCWDTSGGAVRRPSDDMAHFWKRA